MTTLFDLEPSTLTVLGTERRFPVRRIYCVGRNYLDHVREMGEGDERDDPFFFHKPADAIVEDGAAVPYPPRTQDLQFEGELVVAIGSAAREVPLERASEAVLGYAAGIDLTRRDRQRECRDRQVSWEAGKSFDHSAPCGPITPRDAAGDVRTAELRLSVDGQVRQRTPVAAMIWDVGELVAHLSSDYRLMPGDLIFTGTPAGVGPVHPGQQVRVEVDGLSPLQVTITDDEGAPRATH